MKEVLIMSNETVKVNGQDINMSDLQAALAAQGLDIRELAKQAKALKNGEIKNPERKVGVSTLTFKLALVNYPDFCIERSTAKTRQLIVIMPSCKGYYVKSFKGEDEFIEELTPELYSKVTSGMNDLELPSDFWLRKVCSGKKFGDLLLRALKGTQADHYVEMIKYRIAPKLEDMHLGDWGEPSSNEQVKAYKQQPVLYREFFNSNKAKAVLINSPRFVENLVDDFGLNNTRDFLTQLDLSLVEVGTGYYGGLGINRYGCSKSYPDMEMKYDAFRDYVLYQSVFMGYGKTINTFFTEWVDSIKMQQDIYHKIKEKYHDNLPLWHHQLAYKSSCMREQIDALKMQDMVDLAALYQGTSGKYVFISPTCKQDFLDEAQMQQNCLASYVNKFVDGDCIIMFMREKKDPTQSLVTIEIRKDDDGNYTHLNQKYQSRNRQCTAEQSDAIDKWLKRAINRVNKKKKGEEIEVDEELAAILSTLED
jgi:hypothetical protein